MKEKQTINGVRARYIFIPAIIIISICLTLVIVATILVTYYTRELTERSKNVSDCIDEIGYIQSTSSKLSETASIFVYTPTAINENTQNPVLLPSGMEVVIEGPLAAYLEDYNDPTRKPEKVLENIKKYELSSDKLELINDAIEMEKYLFKEQAHSFYLLNSVSTITLPEKLMNSIEVYKLTPDEIGMSDDDKRNIAFKNLLNKSYSDAKGVISTNIRKVTEMLNGELEEFQTSTSLRLHILRVSLWLSLSLVLASTVMLFYILLRRLVNPIILFSKRIDNNKKLDEKMSLYEVNALAHAYNMLLERHKEFDNELQKVAETDSLTGLPNRFAYNEYLKQTPEKGVSACVFLCDLNNLKVVNDTHGHKAGDELIIRASKAIVECFGKDGEKNCFRFGGDEFIAIIDDIKEDEIKSYITKFNECQKKYDVSVAIGYSYSPDVSVTGYEKIIMEADTYMYINKKRIHEDSK